MNPSQLKIMERILDYLPDCKSWTINYETRYKIVQVVWKESGYLDIIVNIGEKGGLTVVERLKTEKSTFTTAQDAWQKLRALRKNRFALKALDS